MTETKNNNYELYRKIKTKEDYFSSWTHDSLQTVTDSLSEVIYDKYVVKCKVFQRDKFKCQNMLCETPSSPLTYHHIKWQKNNGADKIKNGVTLCKPCHMGFHKARREIKYYYTLTLPAHIRGHTFKLPKSEKVDWKTIRFEMRKLRKNLKHEYGLVITTKQWILLMKFLTIPYYEWDD